MSKNNLAIARKNLEGGRYILSLVLAAVLMLSGFLTTMAYADEPANTLEFSHNSSTNYVQGENIASGSSYKSSAGDISYCLNEGRANPEGTYSFVGYVPDEIAAILDHGYPNTSTINGVKLTGAQARQATQVAIWAANESGYGNQIDLDNMHGNYGYPEIGNKILTAAKWLYNTARHIEPVNTYAHYSKGLNSGYQDMVVAVGIATDGDLELVKTSSSPSTTDDNSSYSLKGAKYGVYDDENDLVQTITTNSEGEGVAEGLPLGTYTVKEISASPGYLVDTTAHKVIIDDTNGETLKVKETPQYGKIRLYKTCVNEELAVSDLAGAKYQVKNDSGDVVSTITTDADGYAETGNLPLGNYTVKETAAPMGYAIDSKTYTASLRYSSSATSVTATVDSSEVAQNEPLQILLYKTDSETNSNEAQGAAILADAEFTVRYYSGFYDTADAAESSGNVSSEWVFATDAEGQIKLAEDYKVSGDPFYTDTKGAPCIPLGTVLIQETKAPSGYLINDDVFLRQITSEGSIETVHTYNAPTIENQVKRGDLELTKTAEVTNAHLAGVPFRIISETTGESHVAVTDENGYLNTSSDVNPHTYNTNSNDADTDGSFDSTAGIWFGAGAADDSKGALPFDSYTVEELRCKANEGYDLLTIKGVKISHDARTVDLGTLTDNLEQYAVIEKIDAVSGRQLAGAILEVYKKNDSAGWDFVNSVTTTDDAWKMEVSEGNYRLHEAAVPEGYMLADDIEFTVSPGVALTFIQMEDDYTKTDISKQDITTGKEIEGAELTLYDSEGRTVDSWVSGGNRHRIDSLAPGEYTLHEVTAPYGYLVAEDVVFTVAESGDVQTVIMYDDYTKLDISKQDITTGKEIEGAEMELLDSEGSVIAKWVSTAKPYRIEMLPVGEYTLHESLVPAGYVTAEDVVFTITATGEIQKAVMYDDHTRVSISKQDITTNKEIEGAELTLYDSEGRTVDSWVSGTEAHMIEYLPVGEYVLHEVTAPEGYEVAEDVAFTVKDTGEIQTVVMHDKPIPVKEGSYDQTGDRGYFQPLFTVAVMLIFVAATSAAVVAAVHARERRKDRKNTLEEENDETETDSTP